MRKLTALTGLMLAASVLAVTPAVAGNGKGNSGNGKGNGGSSSSSGSSGSSGASGSSGSSGSQGSSGSSGSSGSQGASGASGASGSGGGATVATLPVCKLSDLSSPASACGGFFQGNLLSNNQSDVAAQTDALAALGLANWNGSIVEPQLNLASSLVNFSTGLYGLTYVGIHFGGGSVGPSPQTPGGVTAFYAFDAGLNLDSFTLAYGAASAARLYLTQAAPPPVVIPPPVVTPPVVTPPVVTPIVDPPAPPQGAPEPPVEPPVLPPVLQTPLATIAAVPEPATWTMMILGFGCVGGLLRARRRVAA